MFNAWLHARAIAVGEAMQMRTGSGKKAIVVGTITAFDPPHWFAHTMRFTTYDDPECEVIYELKQLPGGVECTLIVEGMPVGTKTAKDMQSGGTMVVNRLKSIVETGKPATGVRVLYWIFDKMEFVLPKRTEVDNWPMKNKNFD